MFFFNDKITICSTLEVIFACNLLIFIHMQAYIYIYCWKWTMHIQYMFTIFHFTNEMRWCVSQRFSIVCIKFLGWVLRHINMHFYTMNLSVCRSSVPNVLLTSSADNVCRIWSETVKYKPHHYQHPVTTDGTGKFDKVN